MLSVEIGATTKNLSRAINSYLKKSSFDLINELRVEEAKKRLRAHADSFTIDSVAEECGFRSRSTFYAAFKKAEGKTPTLWIKGIVND